MPRIPRRFIMPCLPVFCLGLALAVMSASPALAGQNIEIDDTVTHSVYGNGSTNDDGEWDGSDPDDLEDPSNNTVTVNSGGVVNSDAVTGGHHESSSDSATASYNTVTINGGTVNGTVIGGFAAGNTASTASHNTVTINGGKVTGDVVGGRAINENSGTATYNTITIGGNQEFDPLRTNLIGGDIDGSGDAFTGNTLNLHSSITVGSVRNFEYLNFYLPEDLEAGDTMLTIGDDGDNSNGVGEAIIDNSIVNVGIDGASTPLRTNDTVILIDASAGTLTGSPVNSRANGQGMQGVTLKYDFAISAANNQLLARVLAKPVVNEKVELIPTGFLADLILVNQGADLVAGQGMANATAGAAAGFGIFAALAGGWSKYGANSHVDMSSQSILTGFAWGVDTTPGRLTLGAFFEYGHGSYDTGNSLSAAESVTGDGHADRLGGGILGRMDFRNIGPGHLYAEASGRAGGVRNEYGSSDLVDAMGRSAEFDSSTAYYGLHLGGGYLWNINEKASLDLYGKYFWSHVNSNSVTLSTGDPVRFDSADSHRLRLGGRFAYAVDEYVTPYIGAAYEHEFNGKLRASAHGYGIGEPSIRGGAGMAEVGLVLKPSRNLPLSFDLGVRAYAGKRDGVIGALRIGFVF